MVKHVVMWRLKEQANGLNQAELGAELKVRLESLVVKIPEIRSFEVGLNIAPGETASHVVLVSAFDDMGALERYVVHPDHQLVVAFVREVVSERRVVDFEQA